MLAYLQDSELFELQTQIVEINGNAIVLQDTIFHPQGGGQQSDRGTIDGIPVLQVRKSDKIEHGVEAHEFQVRQTVQLKIDSQWRLRNAKLHTAGHLLAHIVEKHFPLKGVSGHHFDGQARVTFDASGPVDKKQLVEKLEDLIKQDYDFTVQVSNGEHRSVQMADFEPVGCGGTHLKSTKDIRLKIRNVKNTKGQWIIGYDLH
ncbi:Threonyl/alanyl tRNA synthetase [Gorgonomyces haynaldii]|nr:Threonyl/alanyl tRNA synthetase [Gorgonomyces haynaldii]